MISPLLRPSYVVDSSVAVKWYVERDEPGVDLALQLLEAYQQGRCVLKAPELLVFEVANALIVGHRQKPSIVLGAVSHLKGLEVDLEGVKWSTMAKAVEIASDCDTTVYDSYFLALALTTDSTLVTADNIFLRKTRHYPGVVPLAELRLS